MSEQHTKSPLQFLREGQSLFSAPERWTRMACARDAEGTPLARSNDPRAVCWCTVGGLGSLARAHEGKEFSRAVDFLHVAAAEMGFRDAFSLNDRGSYAQVVLMFERGVALAEAAEVAP